MFLERWTERYLAHLTMLNRTPVTIKAYRERLERFAWFAHELGVESLEGITGSVITRYLDYLVAQKSKRQGTPHANKTVWTFAGALKGFLRYLHQDERISRDLSLLIEMKIASPKIPGHVFTESEIKRVLAGTGHVGLVSKRNRFIAEFLYATGIRRKEAVDIDVEDIDFREKQIFIREGKGRRDRIVPMAPVFEQKLKVYMETTRPWFIRHQHADRKLFLRVSGQKFSVAGFGAVVSRTIEAAGLTGGAHSLRHAFATHLLQRGANLLYIQRLLGHKNASTTMIYTRIYPRDLRDVVLRCHPRSLVPVAEIPLPIRMSNVRLTFLLKLKSRGIALDPSIYHSEKLTKTMAMSRNHAV
ncbi:MAG: tyrosine-type recombinase/integrase [Spirochaetia bacterium]|nr:tyrosine-type recombinase/integrase [Spirochaetia bacterium]